MKIGLNMLLWTPHVTAEYFPYFSTIRQTGYDGVEIPIFGGEVSHYKEVGKAIKDQGMDCTVVSVIPDEEHNPISPEAKHRQGAVDYLKHVIDCCAAMDAEVLCGPLYQPLGVFTGTGPTQAEKDRAVEVHRTAADYARQANVVLAVESLNRFECYFLNILADAAAHARRVNHPFFGVMYDTFHGNVEEKDPVGCIAENIDMLRHVHISSNDRGTPGRGHIPWARTFQTLRQGGYDGWLTIEAFGRTMPDLAATTKIWRDISAGPEEVYQTGYKTIREGWDAAA
ncbi:MAG: sugar phosphate isomerase/epimerase [Sedimentisphaerales bacterium]|nr:sugar phosphate isomerase/epimerase [Sedimentisphaerales bacterium]